MNECGYLTAYAEAEQKNLGIKLPGNFYKLNKNTAELFKPYKKSPNLNLQANKKKRVDAFCDTKFFTKVIVKILNTQGFNLKI